MPADRVYANTRDQSARRSVVPSAAGQSLWRSAAWTGFGAAAVGTIVGIAVVAVCWLPASAGAGSANSAIRAGVLTFLAALHGGITVDGLDANFLPLGMTMLLGGLCWRAGAGLADAAADLDEDDTGRLLRAGATQAMSFAAVCTGLAVLAPLGTSSVSPVGAALASLILFTCTGGLAFVRWSALGDVVLARMPSRLPVIARAASVGMLTYLAIGAVLAASSLVVHRANVEMLSHQVGGGWSGIPVLALGLLAAPNAAIAAASYLAGPGFAVDTGNTVALGNSAHGTLPAFPLLGAVPTGPGSALAWALAVVTPLLAGVFVAATVGRDTSTRMAWRHAGIAAVGAGLLGVVLSWLGGGAIGSGRLSTVGAAPWQFGLAVTAEVGVAAALALGVRIAWQTVAARRGVHEPAVVARLRAVVAEAARSHDEDEADELAG